MLNSVLLRLKHNSNALLELFTVNFMTLHESKCHLLVCRHKDECSFPNIGNTHNGVGKPAGAAGAARRQLQVSQAGRAKLEILKYYIVHRTAWFDNRS